MNPGLVVKLRPAGPWRIGPDSGARNRVDAIYHSDSLYGAVTSAMSRIGSLSAWLDATARSQTPAVCFSSCFPFLDDMGFVVPPRTIWPPTSPAAMSARVRWKSARFIPLSLVESILSGKKLNEHQWSVDGASGCLVPAGKPGPFRTSVRWNAAVDRLSGSCERHATACIEFREGCGLWTVAGFRDEAAREQWQEPVKAAFRWLADSGFGGERSRGWGRSETPEFVEGTLPGLVVEYRRREPAPAVEEPPVEEPPVKEAPMVEPPPAEEPLPEPERPVEAEAAPPVSKAEAAPETELAAEGAPAAEPAAPETVLATAPAPEAEAAAPEPEPAAAAEAAAPAVEAATPETVAAAEAAAPGTEPVAEEESSAPAVEAAVPETGPAAAPETEPAAEAAPATEPDAPAAELDAEGAGTPIGAATGVPPWGRERPEPATEPAAEAAAPETEPAAEAESPAPAVALSKNRLAGESACPTRTQALADQRGTDASVCQPGDLGDIVPAAEPAPAAEAAAPAAEPAAPAPEPEAAPQAEPALSDAPISAALRAPDRTEPMRLATEREAAPAVPVPAVHLQAHWLLSLFTPAADDAVDWGRGSYTVLARGGRIDSPSGSGELKKQIQMVAEGSVLYADGVPLGAAPDVAPDGFAHPVFRAGFALAIPLPEVH
jgi:CRISPR type III-A-associated RAMP protein Csm4